MAKQITMQQVADELKLSRRTVSAVLNDNTTKLGIASKTINRVKQYMDERGYVPSRQAVSLKMGITEKIGVFYCGQLYTHLLQAFGEITSLYNDQPDQLELVTVPQGHAVSGVRELLARGVTRLVWIHTFRSRTELAQAEIYNYLTHFEQVVIYNYRYEPNDNSRELLDKGINLVGMDRLAGYEKIADLLKNLGHRKIAVAGADFQRERTDLFEKAGFDCTPLAEEREAARSKKEWGRNFARTLTEMRRQGITAAVFHDNELAAFTLAFLKEDGVLVPEDLTVTGFEDMLLTELASPPLTSLSIPLTDMVAGVKKLIDNGGTGQRHCLELDLLERKSHGPAAG